MVSVTTAAPAGLSIDGVCLGFGGNRVLHAVSFDVEPGEVLALIGPNGAGKTSLVNVITNVYRPQEGGVTVTAGDATVDILRVKPHQLVAHGIARTFQNLLLEPQLSALDNVLIGRHSFLRAGPLSSLVWWGRARREDASHRAVCWETLDFLGLAEYAHQPVGRLPYGIQKRIEVARALATRPRLLLLDEPAAGLNDAESAEMIALIELIRASGRCTQLLIDHDMNLVMTAADRIAVLNFGELITIGPTAEVRADPRVIAAYLGAAADGEQSLSTPATSGAPAAIERNAGDAL
jgi:branched-chain amino acid transport system ATP-binding protein